MNDFTSTEPGSFHEGDAIKMTTSRDPSTMVRKGDAIKMTPDLEGTGTKVVVSVKTSAYITVRDVRWYDHVRWGTQRIVAWVRQAILNLMYRSTP